MYRDSTHTAKYFHEARYLSTGGIRVETKTSSIRFALGRWLIAAGHRLTDEAQVGRPLADPAV